ncbi:peptidylprolyl isomerase [Pendulispora albinea]|uniref:Peptidylprolyl isomerase n=1 Tax=Pendulispora albinea TaxID=2741071 RepID=A0ABZ2LNH0_9BACT
MLDLFRKRGVTSFIYGAIIIGMVLVFVLEFGPSAGQKKASLSTACVATVKGHCVDPKDFSGAYRILIPRDEDGMRRAKQMGLRKVALDGLIERELLVSEAERLGLTVTKDELDDSIYQGFIHVSVPSDNPQLAYQLRIGEGRLYAGFKDPKSKHFDMAVYKRTIRNLMGRSEIEFREEQGREILAAKMRDLIRAPVRVSEVEALEAYIDEKSSATVESVAVKTSYAGKYAVAATDADVAKWAADKENQKQIDDLVHLRKADSDPKANHVRHILVRAEKSASIEEKGLALGKLAEAAARIKRGEAFADVAREVSQDPGSAMRGGDLGEDTKGFVEPFRVAANALKPGEVTAKAIETQFGYHLIAKDDPAKAAEIEAAVKKGAARELYVKGKALEAAKDLANKIQAGLKAGKSPDDAIREATLPLKRPTAAIPTLLIQEESAAAADAGAADKKEGKEEKKNDKKADKSDGGAAKDVVIARELTPENDPDRPKLETSSSFNRGGDPIPGLSPETAQKVLAFAFEGASGKSGDLYAEPLRTDDGFTVIRLKEHKSATKEEFEKDRDTYMQTLLAAKQAEALAIYVKRLRETSKGEIKTDETYLRDPSARDGGAPADMDDEGP